MKKVLASVVAVVVATVAMAADMPGNVNFKGDVNFDAGCVIKMNGTTVLASDLALAGTSVKATVNAAATVTNNMTVTLAAGQVNILTPTLQIPLGTNTILLAAAAAADVGKITVIQNAQTATNILKIAASTGFYYGPEINLASNECAIVFSTATNKYSSLGNQ
jgi:hypothetical protein